jgi:DNA replication regulator DPB11
MWLERCLDAKAMVPPESHVTSTPFPQFPIPDFQEMHICSTGFSGLDLLHLSKLVNIMGATYDEYLTPNASVLICNDPNSVNPEKLRHTFGWGIPTVSADWLWISIQAGYKKPFESYLLQRLQSQIENCKTECRDKLVQPQSVERKRAIESEPPEDNADSRQTGGSARSPSVRKGAPEDVATNKESDPILKESRPNLPTNDPYGSLGSPSPTKDQGELGVPLERRESSESRLSNSTSAASKALDLAVSGLLKKARARSHLSLIASDTSNERPQPKRRKPLLGRAGSLSSTNAFGRQGASRASSIDSLNGDGCEDSIDGLDMEPSHNNTSRNNLNGQSFHSVLSAGNLSIYGELPPDDTEYRAEREAEVEDQEVLLMTQLNYEDPDAVAMRQEFMRRAGKPENKEPGPRTLVLGELKDLDVSRGWRPGRRTRKARKTTEVEDNLF